MTTQSKKRYSNWKNKNVIRFATWNINSFNNKDQEILKKLTDSKSDMGAIQESKKKGKEQKLLPEHIRVTKNERAK